MEVMKPNRKFLRKNVNTTDSKGSDTTKERAVKNIHFERYSFEERLIPALLRSASSSGKYGREDSAIWVKIDLNSNSTHFTFYQLKKSYRIFIVEVENFVNVLVIFYFFHVHPTKDCHSSFQFVYYLFFFHTSTPGYLP